MNGGVVGNPVEPENLVETQPQQYLEPQLLRAPAGFARDEPVQRRLPADGAIGQLLAKAAVWGR
jgi:hypothetical protein